MILTNKDVRENKTEYRYHFYWYEDVDIYDLLKQVIYAHRNDTKQRINASIERATVGKGKAKKTYFNIPCGFDIETTTINKEFATMYCWQFSIFNNVIMGNSWGDFLDVLDTLKEIIKPKPSQRIIVWIHNASYEYGFLKHYLKIENEYDYFFREIRSQLNFTHDGFIQFRDSMAMVNGSLKALTETYDLTTKKCKGDLDYNIIRTWKSAKMLTDRELQYCHNDVLILSEFATVYFNTQLKQDKNPLTITGMVRNAIADNITDAEKELLRKSKPVDEYLYNFLSQKVYRGGYTHANEYTIGELYDESDKITGFDYTSSYPSCLCYEKFPLSKWYKYEKTANTDRLNHLKWCIDNDYACIMKVTVKGCIRKKYTGHSIESKSKVFDLKNEIIDNGRIYKGDFTTYITELDYLSYCDFYDWEEFTIEEMYVSKKEYLPKGIINTIITYYTNKSIKKHNHEPYKLDKALCNSIYGMFCTRKPIDKIVINDTNDAEKIEGGADDFEKWNNKEGNYLPIGVGVYTSAYARRNLLKSVAEIERTGKIVAYCDTDSLKIIDTDSIAIDVIKSYNRKIKYKRDLFFARYPHTNKSVFDDLGMFDFEYGEFDEYGKSEHGKVTHFKTLGTKRYLISADNGKEVTNNQTISGLSKGILFKDCKTDEDINKVYESFTDKLFVQDCKLTTYFNDEPKTMIVHDQIIDEDVECFEQSNIALISTSFTLKIEKWWLGRLKEIEEERKDSVNEYRED